MPLKESLGNMYEWVTHTHTHLGGECPHHCPYCYVDHPRWGRPERYKGELRLIEEEFRVKYGSGKTIFVENCNDLFAEAVPEITIMLVIGHCIEYPKNTYVFQTKNPDRYNAFLLFLPEGSILGTTIETNRDTLLANAPSRQERAVAMATLKWPRKFVTIEPVMDFDVEPFAAMIGSIKPEFINLGADSKGKKLPEPTVEKVHALVEALKAYGVDLRIKTNLSRLK